MSHGQQARPVRSAFTLVELLVVIGIIALLISILLPVLNKVQEQARTTKCLANMNQIGKAFVTYALDNHNLVCPCGYQVSAANTEHWGSILVAGKYLPRPLPLPQSASDTTPPQMSVLYCTNGLSDFDWVAAAQGLLPTSRYDFTGAFGFRVNSQLAHAFIDTWYGINCTPSGCGYDGSSVATAKSAHAFPVWRLPNDQNAADWSLPKWPKKHTSELVLIFDGYYLNLGADTAGKQNRINARHNSRTATNILFFDGHVQTYNIKDIPPQFDLNTLSQSRWMNIRWRLDQPD